MFFGVFNAYELDTTPGNPSSPFSPPGDWTGDEGNYHKRYCKCMSLELAKTSHHHSNNLHIITFFIDGDVRVFITKRPSPDCITR